eukprot:6396575-Pyramimonas_sp.AAC.1
MILVDEPDQMQMLKPMLQNASVPAEPRGDGARPEVQYLVAEDHLMLFAGREGFVSDAALI